MDKGRRTMIFTISIMSLLLACVMFMQFKVVNETDIAEIEGMRESELEKAIVEWKDKQEEVAKKLADTNKKIKEYNEKLANTTETRELVKKELTEAKKNFGLTDVTGEGVIVTLTDTEEKNYQAEDLLELVNELRDAGAEAISINNERITNITDVVDISTRYIVVNSNKVASPYTVKAIGDKTYLKSALTIKNGYRDIKQKAEYQIFIQEATNIKIQKYTKGINLKYIEL